MFSAEQKKTANVNDEKASKFTECLKSNLGEAEYSNLRFVCAFLWRLSLRHNVHKMTVANLSIVFAFAFFQTVSPLADVAAVMIGEFKRVFNYELN